MQTIHFLRNGVKVEIVINSVSEVHKVMYLHIGLFVVWSLQYSSPMNTKNACNAWLNV